MKTLALLLHLEKYKIIWKSLKNVVYYKAFSKKKHMSDFIKIESADYYIKNVLVELNHLESVFEYEKQAKDSSIDTIIDSMDKSILDWGHKARRLLLKSKTKEAQELVGEYESLFEDFITDLKAQEDELQKYTVLKCFSGNFYTAKNTLEEIEDLISEAKHNSRMGINQ